MGFQLHAVEVWGVGRHVDVVRPLFVELHHAITVVRATTDGHPERAIQHTGDTQVVADVLWGVVLALDGQVRGGQRFSQRTGRRVHTSNNRTLFNGDVFPERGYDILGGSEDVWEQIHPLFFGML
ncbi:hypothetical protein D3C80_1391340 [compost metagenome]